MMLFVAVLSFIVGGLFGVMMTAVLTMGRNNWDDDDWED